MGFLAMLSYFYLAFCCSACIRNRDLYWKSLNLSFTPNLRSAYGIQEDYSRCGSGRTKEDQADQDTKVLVFSLAVLFLGASVSLAWVIKDYLSIKRSLPHLNSLQEENTLQKQQINSLAGKVETITKSWRSSKILTGR